MVVVAEIELKASNFQIQVSLNVSLLLKPYLTLQITSTPTQISTKYQGKMFFQFPVSSFKSGCEKWLILFFFFKNSCSKPFFYSFIHWAYWFFYCGSQTVPQAGELEMNNHEFGPHNSVERNKE